MTTKRRTRRLRPGRKTLPVGDLLDRYPEIAQKTRRSVTDYYFADLAYRVIAGDPACEWVAGYRTILTELGRLPEDRIFETAQWVCRERRQFKRQAQPAQVIRWLREYRRRLRVETELRDLVTRVRHLCRRQGGEAGELVEKALDGMGAPVAEIAAVIPRLYRFRSHARNYHIGSVTFRESQFATIDANLAEKLMGNRYLGVDYWLLDDRDG